MQEYLNRTDRQSETETLLLRLAAGDGSAIEPLYNAIRPGVYAYALSITRSVHDAEDVLHDTLLRIADAADRYRPNGRPMPWVLTIARNLALMRLRERGRADMMPYEDWESLTAHLPRVTPEDRLVLYSALFRLTEVERQIVTLHAVGGFLHRECAAMLHLPLSTVLSKYNRAIKKLQRSLTEANSNEATESSRG